MNRSLFVPIAAVRPYLALKGTLLLLAFDLWVTRLSHAGRYGAGGFNVAHVPWLDAIQPQISPALHIGVCLLTSVLCLAIVFAHRPPRWLFGLCFAVHTWSWGMSMLDSYQHHYLLSLVLLCMIFFPPLSADEALVASKRAPKAPPAKGKRKKRKKKKKAPGAKPVEPSIFDPFPLASAWGYVALAGSVAIVYSYTAFAKTAPDWLSGASLRRVLHLDAVGMPAQGAADPIGPFRELLAMVGVEGETFWLVMGHSVVLVQIICATGYLLSPFRDVAKAKALRFFYWVAFFTALSFHVGAEYMGLKIGWFSWYMIGYAAIFFLPASWLVAAARVVIPLRGVRYRSDVVAGRIVLVIVLAVVGAATSYWPLVWLAVAVLFVAPLRWASRAMWRADVADVPPQTALALTGIGALGLVVSGYAVDLPGAPEASIVAAVGLGAGVVVLLVLRGHARPMVGYAVGATLASAALVVSVLLSDVRWDYYRNVGGDHRRRGEVEEAYNAYVKANRYAPEGEDRAARETEMREILERRGVLEPLPEEP